MKKEVFILLLGSNDPKAFRGGIVNAIEIQDASITGFGRIDGQGFKNFYPTNGPRHNNILLSKSRNITVKDVTLVNSSNWIFRIRDCVGVIGSGVRIYSFANESLITSSITGIPGSYAENVIIKNVIFTCKGTANLEEAGLPVPEKEASYPENRMFGYSLPAYRLYVRHVKGLIFEDLSFGLLAPDSRPAIILDDCHNIKIGNFTAARPVNNQPLLRLINSTNVLVSGYQSLEKLPVFVAVEGEKSSDIKLAGNDFTGIENVMKFSDGAQPAAVKMMSNFQNQTRDIKTGEK